MSKQKTHKGLKKRVKITASGRIKHRKAGKGHLMSSKTAKRKRHLSASAILQTVMAKKMKAKLPD